MKKRIGLLCIIVVVCVALTMSFVGCRNTTVRYENADKYSVGEGTYSAALVKSINVAWDKGEILVVASTEYNVVKVFEENSETDARLSLHRYLDSEGTLWVKPVAADVEDEEFPSEWTTKKVTVQMPKTLALKSLYCEDQSYNITIRGVKTAELTTYNMTKDTSISDVEVSGKADIKVDGLSGDALVSGTFMGETKISSDYKVSFTSSRLPSSLEATGKAKVTVSLPESSAFKLTVSAASELKGTLKQNLVEDTTAAIEGKKVYKYNNGTTNVNLSCSKRALFDNNNIITVNAYVAPIE